MKTPAFVISILALFSASVFAGQVDITGNIQTESGTPLANAEIQVNGNKVFSNASGRFSVVLPSADLYAVSYSANGHFPMIHSFSALELSQFKKDGDTTSLPVVSLVERKQGRIMLAIGGDAMTGRRFSRPTAGEPVMIRQDHKAEDTAALLKYISPYLQLADFTSVNLEAQVMATEPEAHAPKSVVFFSPPETLSSLAEAGVDYVTLGNNHMFDYLDSGMDSTVNALNASPLAWSGGGRTESESLQAYRTEIGENAFSFLGYVGWSGNFNPNQTALGMEKGGAALGSMENIKRTVRREAESGYLPVIQYHGSREYQDEPTLVTETRLKAAIDEGAVLAIGHHPHVTQGFEIYKGRLIAYSMGNFLFDQYHYATQRSYLLYVWLDGDRLHRAEAMPLHIKGYVPMPATDTVRQTILKRVYELSSRRDILVRSSGGNAVILPQHGGDQQKAGVVIPVPTANDGVTVWSLEPASWNKPAVSISSGEGQARPVLLGKNLLPTGHLESHYFNGAPDRAWIEGSGQAIINDASAPSGKQVMQLIVPAGQEKGRIGMRTFEYTFEPGTPTTFVLKARANAPARVTAYQQWRKRSEGRLEALEKASLRPISQLELESGDWQELRFDFNSPRVTAISYRIVMEVEPLDSNENFDIRFDDIGLIEWLSPPLSAGDIPAHVNVSRASHIGLSDNTP